MEGKDNLQDNEKKIDIKKLAGEMIELIDSSRKRGAIGINSHIRIMEIMKIVGDDSKKLLEHMKNDSLSQKDRKELEKLL